MLVQISGDVQATRATVDALRTQVTAQGVAQAANYENHDQRLRSLEAKATSREADLPKWAVVQSDVESLKDWRTEVATTTRNSIAGAKLLWAVVILLAGVIGWGAKTYIESVVTQHVQTKS